MQERQRSAPRLRKMGRTHGVVSNQETLDRMTPSSAPLKSVSEAVIPRRYMRKVPTEKRNDGQRGGKVRSRKVMDTRKVKTPEAAPKPA